MRIISYDSFNAIASRSLSQSTGTVTRPRAARVRPEVELVEATSPGDRVGKDTRAVVEGPAILAHEPMHTTDSQSLRGEPRRQSDEAPLAPGKASSQ